ncbi:MAG: site-specific DNA-methyltransferase [Chloroflexi bacterium]|nr:site-specific DNA-methyltransferase [Chloroflexota bacterium]
MLNHRYFRLNSRPGDVILDPFAGSATQLAALQVGRRFLGIELHPEYVEMAEERVAVAQPTLPLAG